MNKIIGIGVVALAITFAACESRGSARGDAKNGVTATGCVKAEPGREDHFVLTNANVASSPAAAPSSANDPNAPAASSTASAGSYQLDGRERDLKQHVNQRVEVIGKLDQPTRNSQASDTTYVGQQQIKVDSVRLIAASCL